MRRNIARFTRRSLLNCISPLEADIIGTHWCRAVKIRNGSDANRQAETFSPLAAGEFYRKVAQ
jgi:hypothetical protein